MRAVTANPGLAALLIIAIFTTDVGADSIRWTCPHCHAEFLFDPRDREYAAEMIATHASICPAKPVSITHLPIPEPTPVQRLSQRYRDARNAVARAFEPYVPPHLAGDLYPGTLADLGASVAALLGSSEAELDRIEWTNGEIGRAVRALEASLGGDRATLDSLARLERRIRSEIARLERDREAEERGVDRLNDELVAVQGLVRRIRDDFAPARRSAFSRLETAFDRGVVRRPSAFLSRPAPPEPKYIHRSWAVGAVPVPMPRALYAVPAVGVAARPRASPPPRREIPRTEQAVEEQLGRVEALPPRIRAAIDDLRGLLGRREQLRQQARASSQRVRAAQDRLHAAEAERDAVSEAIRGLRSAGRRLSGEIEGGRSQVYRELVSWALWSVLDREIARLLEIPLGSSVRADFAVRFGHVMEDVVTLGEDITEFLPRAARGAASVSPGEDRVLARIQEAMEKFRIKAALHGTDSPPWDVAVWFGRKPEER